MEIYELSTTKTIAICSALLLSESDWWHITHFQPSQQIIDDRGESIDNNTDSERITYAPIVNFVRKFLWI